MSELYQINGNALNKNYIFKINDVGIFKAIRQATTWKIYPMYEDSLYCHLYGAYRNYSKGCYWLLRDRGSLESTLNYFVGMYLEQGGY